MTGSIEARIHGTRTGYFVREFFTNSAYFPLTNIFLELLTTGPEKYLQEPDPYVLLFCAVAQAWYISRRAYGGGSAPLLGNLVGPLIYTSFEVLMEGVNFTASANHIAYWGFGLAIGISSKLHTVLPGRIGAVFLLIENMARTSILLVMYTILEFMKDDYGTVWEFLQDPPHIFITVAVPFIGLITGVANINAERYLRILRETAGQLRQYSQWLLGKELLAQAVSDPRTLSLTRHQRAMLFMDIRGFTAWSEVHQPEQVVATMNAYYEAAEPIWHRYHAIKVKFTADEIMLVFADATDAVEAAREMLRAIEPVLAPHSLSAGIGLHVGPVVEGLMGASEYKGYDLLGDSVNIAKRLCDNAVGGEILITEEMVKSLTRAIPMQGPRGLEVKGKQLPLTVYAVV
jgi:class 3 adenylate cyclase